MLNYDNINANFNNGVLSIEIPKKNEDEGKRFIEIK